MKAKTLKIFGSIAILLFYSCYKEDTVDCEIIAKVCGEVIDSARECEYVFECKTK